MKAVLLQQITSGVVLGLELLSHPVRFNDFSCFSFLSIIHHCVLRYLWLFVGALVVVDVHQLVASCHGDSVRKPGKGCVYHMLTIQT